MYRPIDSEGLRRVASLHLKRHHPASRSEAMRLLDGCMGAYDDDKSAITEGVDAYFDNRVMAGS